LAIEAHNVTKRFGDFAALDDVSINVESGSLTALLGPSGSGKSTLLRVIAGLEVADSGDVFISGKEATALAPQKRGVGFVFQHYAPFKHMTVWENVAFGLKIRRRPKDEVTARVEEVDRLMGLDIGADDYVCKPFSPRELVARVRALLRRARPAPRVAPVIEIDEVARRICVRGQPLDLTPSEFALFATMARRTGTAWSRAALLERLRAESPDVGERAIDSHVKNLRRKLAAALPGVEVLQSVYGLGYRVTLPDDVA